MYGHFILIIFLILNAVSNLFYIQKFLSWKLQNLNITLSRFQKSADI